MRVSAEPLQTLGGEGVDLGSLPDAAPWLFTNYVEVVAQMPHRGALAGLALYVGVGGDVEIHLATGVEGDETSIGHFRIACHSTAPGTGGHFDIMLPVPLVLPDNSRISARARGSNVAMQPVITLSYYPDPTFLHLTEIPITSAPAGEDGVDATLPGVAWEWSDWEDLTLGEPQAIGVYGLACGTTFEIGNRIFEVQIGMGVDPEHDLIGTYRLEAPLLWEHILFTVVHRVTAGIRVAFRVRSPGTETDTVRGTLLFYESVEEVLGGVIGPLLWVEIPRTVQI